MRPVTKEAKVQFVDLCRKCKRPEFNKKTGERTFPYYCQRRRAEHHSKGHPIGECVFFGRR